MNKKKSPPFIRNIVTSFLFLITHFPEWILINKFNNVLFSHQTLLIIGMSIVLGLIFNKSKSLILPIFLHITYNYFAIRNLPNASL
ncbi:CPBP family glutamic-type intramembrane protease [Bacillus salipaludis]|uniref:CPBP family glutamic-type intramembrane protease n=1 Tax=Bacillus salipaludis TaxID=2547811 RepID=UPI0014046BF2